MLHNNDKLVGRQQAADDLRDAWVKVGGSVGRRAGRGQVGCVVEMPIACWPSGRLVCCAAAQSRMKPAHSTACDTQPAEHAACPRLHISTSTHLCCLQALPHIQVRRGLVNHVDIGCGLIGGWLGRSVGRQHATARMQAQLGSIGRARNITHHLQHSSSFSHLRCHQRVT